MKIKLWKNCKNCNQEVECESEVESEPEAPISRSRKKPKCSLNIASKLASLWIEI